MARSIISSRTDLKIRNSQPAQEIIKQKAKKGSHEMGLWTHLKGHRKWSGSDPLGYRIGVIEEF